MTTPTDPELVALAAAGDGDAYAELYHRYLPAARRRAHQLAPRDTDPDDLVSEAFVKMLGAIRHGCRPDPFRAYLLTVIRHDASRLYSQRERYQLVSLHADEGEALTPIDVLALDADPAESCELEPVRQAFRTLPLRWRVALWLNTVEARPPAELALRFGLTPNGVAALTCRARQGLRRAVCL